MTLVLMMGCPGAGKTTICRELISRCPNSALFSLDEVIGRSLDEFDAHAQRKRFEREVKTHLRTKFPWCSMDGQGTNRDNRVDGVDRTETRAARSEPSATTVNGDTVPDTLNTRNDVELHPDTVVSRHLVVVDDIFYLQSMRRPFEIEEDTIRRIAQEMEVPENCLIVKNEVDDVVEKIRETEKEPRIVRHATKRDREREQSPEINEWQTMDKALRDTVTGLVGFGLDGRLLARAKKLVLEDAKREGQPCTVIRTLMKAMEEKYRWIVNKDVYYGTAKNRLWKVERIDENFVQFNVLARSNYCKEAEICKDLEIMKAYLQLDVCLSKISSEWSAADGHIKKLLESNPQLNGIRILDQDPLETLFSFICSANNNIKRISKMVARLCELYGNRLVVNDSVSEQDKCVVEGNPQLLFAFPSIDQMAAKTETMEKQLRSDGFGYRAAYIVKTVLLLSKKPIGYLESLRDLSVDEARAALRALSGVGPKVADCICLMGLGHGSVVPVDTHVFQITCREYRKDLKDKALTSRLHSEIGVFFVQKFGPFAGWAQAVLFNANLTKKRPAVEDKKKPTKKRNVRKC